MTREAVRILIAEGHMDQVVGAKLIEGDINGALEIASPRYSKPLEVSDSEKNDLKKIKVANMNDYSRVAWDMGLSKVE